MGNDNFENLALELQEVIRKYGFANANLTQAIFTRTNSRTENAAASIQNVPLGCRLARDPVTKKWKVVCD